MRTVGGRGSADANGEKRVAMGTGDCGRRRLEVQVSCMANMNLPVQSLGKSQPGQVFNLLSFMGNIFHILIIGRYRW